MGEKYNAGELLTHSITVDQLPKRVQDSILNSKISELKNPLYDCTIDPEEERKYYQKLEEENIRLRKIIKLLSESL